MPGLVRGLSVITTFLAVSLVALTTWVGPVSAAERDLIITQGADYFGRDFDILKEVDLDACKAACLKDKRCVAFTFNTSAGWCFLKSDFTELRGFDGAVAGRIVARAKKADPNLEKTRLSELSFLRPGVVSDAQRFAAKLGQAFNAGGESYGALLDRGWGASGNPAVAAEAFGRALSINPDDFEPWSSFAAARIADNDKDWRNQRRNRQEAVTGSVNAYLRAGNSDEQVRALNLIGRAMAKRRSWRSAIRSYRASLALREDAGIRSTYDSLVAEHGFRIVDHSVESDAAAPRICLVFSDPLPKKRDGLADFVTVSGGEGLSIEVEDKQICADGVKHGQRYAMSVRPGLPGADGEKIEKQIDLDIYVRDRAPSVRFIGRNYVLPAGGKPALPVITVNAEEIEAQVHRIGDRSIANAVAGGTFLRQLSSWQIDQVETDLGEKVWSGIIEVDTVLNQEITAQVAIDDVVGTLKPGAYVMTARAKGNNAESWGPRASQWFVVSDLGLAAFSGNDGMHAFVRSLSSADAMSGVRVRLVAKNDEVLGVVSTDAAGYARFDAGLMRGSGGNAPAILVAETNGGDYGFLDLTKSPYDLTDRGVDGRPAPMPIDVFLTTERGVYRAGETVHVTTLARDSRANAVPGLPLTVIFTRPDGVEHSRVTSVDGGAGGHSVDLPLHSGVMHGTWRVAAYADPKGDRLAEQTFLVEDFLPERIDVVVDSDLETLVAGEPASFSVTSHYLYGPPAGDLPVEATLTMSSVDTLDAWPGYRFGLSEESAEALRQPLDGAYTDIDGAATISFEVPAAPSPTKLFKAEILTRVVDNGGRAVERKIDVPVAPSGPRIGIKPLFEDAVDEGGTAGFEIIMIDESGKRIAADNVTWRLVDIDTSFQWYEQNGVWNYEPVTVTKRIATGTLSIGTDGPAKVESPVKWGRYRLEISTEGEGATASSYGFSAGWYMAQTGADTPDLLRVALDKDSYAVGDTARVHIEPRFGGRAMVMVIDDRLISVREVDVPEEGATVEVPVTAEWGAGAYVAAMLVRPMDLDAKRMPARALGLAWAKVDPADRALSVALDIEERVRPRGPFDIGLTIDNLPKGKDAYVTIAAVDIGILNLTAFKTPAPEKWYFGQRQLGMEIRDLYGQLIDRMQGVPGRVRSGGDEGGMSSSGPPPTEQLIAFFSGIVKVDENGRADVTFDMPDFNGAVRVMAIAWSGDGVGHAEKDVIVRDDIVVLASTPQFMAPGDRSRILVELAHTEGPAGTTTMSISATDELILRPGDANRIVELAEGGREKIIVPVEADSVGDATIDIVVTTPAGVDLTKRLTLGVRSNEQPVTRRSVVALAANGGKLTLDSEPLSEFLSGTGSVSVAVSGAGRIDVPELLRELDRYPYGCAEQITSRALPLVYLDAVSLAAGFGRDIEVRKRIEDAIVNVLTKQSSSGSFGLWGPGYDDLWLDSYVTDFLTRAREKGYAMPQLSFDIALDNLSNRIAYASDFNYGGQDLAYALYVLARNGRASIGDLRYYVGTKLDSFATPLAKAQLGAALALYGDRTRADRAFKAAYADLKKAEEDRQTSRDDYGSGLRDRSALLTLVAETRSKSLDLAALANEVADDREARKYTSTQEKAWMLLAANALLNSASKPDLKLDGRAVGGQLFERFNAAALASAPVTIENAGDTAQTAIATYTGIPRVPEPAGGNGFWIERNYYDLEGNAIDISRIGQNERFAVILSIRAQFDVRGRLMIVDPLPAGVEIDNPNLLSGGNVNNLGWEGLLNSADHTEYRSDRFVAVYNRQPGKNLTFRVGYIARAVSPGTFAHPAATIEDMYRPDLQGRTDSTRIEVIGPLR
ncbi:MAG: alpha-2-macroglobulin [Hyphomicrobiales bacterium]|nr:MAG: alpha-2-macroglobulin [Hyphomicrobiales bacterium]